MNYEFVADSEKLESLHQTIVEETSNVSTALDNIFTAYADLGSAWTGTNYDTFKANVDAKEEEIKKCVEVFTKFAEQVEAAKTDAEKLNTDVSSAC